MLDHMLNASAVVRAMNYIASNFLYTIQFLFHLLKLMMRSFISPLFYPSSHLYLENSMNQALYYK